MTTPQQPGFPGASRALLPWGVARIRGASMLPTLAPGDRVIVRYRSMSTSRIAWPRAIVLARWADGAVVCKRVVEPRPLADGRPGWWLESDNPEQGVDSRHRGPVGEEALVGAVVARIWPRPRLLWSHPPPS